MMFGGSGAGGAGGFSFGNQPKTTANTGGSFAFNAPAATTATTGAFNFGGAPPATGNAAQPGQSAAGSLNFGGMQPQQPQQPASSGPSAFTLGGTSTQASSFGFGTTTAPQVGGGLAGQKATGLGGFGLGGGTAAAVNPAQTTTTTGFGLTAGTAQNRPLTGLAAPTPTASTGFVVGATQPKVTPVAPNTAAPTGLLSQVLNAPSTVAAPQPTAQPQATTAATGGGFSLGGTNAGGLKLGGLGTTTTSAGPTLGGFGTAKVTTTTSAPSLGFNTLGAGTGGLKLGSTTTTSALGTKPLTISSTATGIATKLTTVTAQPTVKAPDINYRQLEEAINKWSLELEDQERIFLQQATQVNAWDRLLIENGEKITKLNTAVDRVKLDQQRLDHELDFILAQQKELEEMLEPLEKAVEQLPPISFQQHADVEREHTYQLAENIDGQLKRMVQDLKEIIDHLNTNNASQDAQDPAHQIARILNAHMDSLQWVDQNSALLQRRVEEVSKLAEQQRKAQERNFRLAYE